MSELEETIVETVSELKLDEAGEDEELPQNLVELLDAYRWFFLNYTPIYIDEPAPGLVYLRFEANDKTVLFDAFGLEPWTQLTPSSWIAENEECFAVEKILLDDEYPNDMRLARAIVLDLPKQIFYDNLPKRLAEDCFESFRSHSRFDPEKDVWSELEGEAEEITEERLEELIEERSRQVKDIVGRELTDEEKEKIRNTVKKELE